MTFSIGHTWQVTWDQSRNQQYSKMSGGKCPDFEQFLKQKELFELHGFTKYVIADCIAVEAASEKPSAEQRPLKAGLKYQCERISM